MRRIIALTTAAIAAAALIAMPVSAEPVQVSFRLSADGALVLPAFPESLPIPADGTGIVGTWDDVTGDFTGEIVFGPVPLLEPPTTPVPVQIVFLGGAVTGNLDPVTGDVELTTTVDVAFTIVPGDPPLDECSIADVVLNLSSTNPGGAGFNPADPIEDWTFTVTAQSFNVAAATCGQPAIADTVNEALGLPTSDTALTLSLEFGQIDTPIVPLDPPIEEIETPEALVEAPRFTG